MKNIDLIRKNLHLRSMQSYRSECHWSSVVSSAVRYSYDQTLCCLWENLSVAFDDFACLLACTLVTYHDLDVKHDLAAWLDLELEWRSCCSMVLVVGRRDVGDQVVCAQD